MEKRKSVRSYVLFALLFALSSIWTNNINTLAQQAESSSNNTGIAPTLSNQTKPSAGQNQTSSCAPQFNSTMVNIPRSDEATPSAGQNQTNNSTLIVDIMSLARENTCYREEIKTTNHTQVVLMSLKPGEEIGLEIHSAIDQLLVFVQGSGMANISGQSFPIKEGDLAYVPAGTAHNFVNTGDTDLKLFTTYSPRNHLPGTLQETKADEAGYVPAGAEEELK
jgi:mannose-6-phosphate isomerase-like protein (cupin superfamily)